MNSEMAYCIHWRLGKNPSHISHLLTTESPVSQWLEHPTRLWRVVGSSPSWSSGFSESPTDAFTTVCLYNSHIHPIREIAQIVQIR